MKVICAKVIACVDSIVGLKDASLRAPLAEFPAPDQLPLYARATALLGYARLACSGLGTNQQSTPIIFTIKRVIQPGSGSFVTHTNSLTAMGIAVGEYKAVSLDGVPVPATAPQLQLGEDILPEHGATVQPIIARMTLPAV